MSEQKIPNQEAPREENPQDLEGLRPQGSDRELVIAYGHAIENHLENRVHGKTDVAVNGAESALLSRLSTLRAQVSSLTGALERSNVLFFLQCNQIATIRESLEGEGYANTPGSDLSLLARMKKEAQEQFAENRAALSTIPEAPATLEGGK